MKTLILGIVLLILGVIYWIYCTWDDKHSDTLPNIGGYFLAVVLFIAGITLILL